MKLKAALLWACMIVVQVAGAQSKHQMNDDAIPTNLPLPQAGVNQRPVVGERKVLLVATHWQGSGEIDMQKLYAETASEQPGSIGDYIRQASMGKLTLKWTTLTARIAEPYPGNFNITMQRVMEAAKQQGYDPKLYDYFFIFMREAIGGEAQMPGNRLIVGGSGYGHFIWAHEFGHNLGFNHGKIYTKCRQANDTVFAPDHCEVINPIPYTKTPTDSGDPVNSGMGLFPANYRWYAGWLDKSQAAVIERSGLYRLGVLGQSGPQLYLINRTGLTPSQIALEFRRPTHYDNFPPTDNRANGVWVRYTTTDRVVTNIQLDATPESATTVDPALQPGKVLKDDTAGITVRVCTTSADGATVAIAINGETSPPCPVIGLPLLPPGIQTPASGAPATPNPVTFQGTSIPGAGITLSYTMSSKNSKSSIETTTADATGVWRITLPSLPPGIFNAGVIQEAGNSTSLINFRWFEVAR